MISRLYNSITGKLFLFFCFFFFILILPPFFIVQSALKQFGEYADTTNTQQIKNIFYPSLSSLVTAQAQRHDEVFTRIKVTASLLAMTATDIYNHLELFSKPPLETIPLVKREKNQIFFSPPSHPIITAFWGDQKISPVIAKEINALSHLSPYLKKTRELIPESLAAHIITASGIGRYYTIDPKAKTQCFDLPLTKDFDLRDGEPVKIFTRPGAKILTAQWTPPYKDDVIEGFMITATAPIVDKAGKFRGIAGIDIPITSVVTDLTGNNARNKADQLSILFGFLMDRNGRLIAFPEPYFDLFSLKIDPGKLKYSRDIRDHNLINSGNSLIKETVEKILTSATSLQRINLAGDIYVLAASQLSETGWHLVLVSREKELLSSVYQTRDALKKSLSTVSGYYLKYGSFISILTIFLILLAVKIFILPIKQLTVLTRKVSDGNLSIRSQISSKNEIGELATAFNQMIAKLDLSEKNEKIHALTLEQRTEQLKRLNEHLVFSEEMGRKAIASDLHDSLAQTLAISISKIKNMTVDNCINLDDLMEIQHFLEQAIREIRSLIYKLSPPILDDFDIDIAIGILVEESNDQHHTSFTYHNNLEEQINLKQALKVTLYRATGELISNILKHAKTQVAEFEISADHSHLYIRVEDKGRGMALKRIEDMKGACFGLYSISERMEIFGGRMDISSTPGQGTKIILTTPIAQTSA